MAIARLGLTPEAFGLMRVGEFWEAIVVWCEDHEADRRGLYTIIRNVGHSLFNIQLDRKDKMPPEKYMRLPWDEERKDSAEELLEMTEEQRQASLDRLLEKINW